uniref:Transposase n=1 Tax=Acrobeloides nanus TaxID=290746 RepID=A0A914C992_9BILA
MITGRTLTFEGEKRVTAVAQRLNALQHSFTIQPVISCTGELLSPMLVVFAIQKEPQIFKQEMTLFENLFAKSTPSGLCDAEIIVEWFQKLMLPATNQGSVLLVDSWGGYNQAIQSVVVQQHLYTEIIPPKATSRIQPLDIYFNRPFKNMLRRISDKTRLKYSDHILAVRENIAKIISLVHYQFTAQRFKPLIAYAWFASGYIPDRPPKVPTPAEYCMDFPPASRCNCNGLGFLRCAHCEQVFCFQHIVVEKHRC